MSSTYSYCKRLIDVVAAAVCLVLFLPLVVCIAAATFITMGRPVFFRQRRPGLNERLFTCYKFRTMIEAPEGNSITDEQRITPFGRVLRNTSLDELPQLWNILKGDLSFVGPRPLLESYLPYYTETERKRHSIRPGLTGWAQIHGRNLLGFDDRLALDVWYVENMSLSLDFRIFMTTIRIVIRRDGVAYPPDERAVPLDVQRRRQVGSLS